jgi:hypothetical protein
MHFCKFCVYSLTVSTEPNNYVEIFFTSIFSSVKLFWVRDKKKLNILNLVICFLRHIIEFTT